MAQFSVMMKAIAVLILLNCVIFSQQDDDARMKIKKDCIAETGADAELVNKAFDDAEFAEDEKLKCFAKCFMQKRGRMDDDGNFIEKEYEGPKKDALMEVFQKCKDQKGDDACETAFLFSKCFYPEIVKF